MCIWVSSMHFCLFNPDGTEKSKCVFYEGLFKRRPSPAGPRGELPMAGGTRRSLDGSQRRALRLSFLTVHLGASLRWGPGKVFSGKSRSAESPPDSQTFFSDSWLVAFSPFGILACFILPDKSKMHIHRRPEIVGVA